MNDKRLKRVVLLMAIGTLLLLLVFNFSAIMTNMGVFVALLRPFIVGAVIALLLNLPLKFFEEKVFDKLVKNKEGKVYKFKRVVGLIVVYIGAVVVVSGVVLLLLPLLVSSISSLTNSIPAAMENFTVFYNELTAYLGFDPMQTQQFRDILAELSTYAMNFIKITLTGLLNATTTLATGLMDGFFSIIISVYYLGSKERMAASIRRSVTALFSATWSKFLVGVGKMCNDQFSRFIGGQIADSFIFGIVMLVVCGLIRIPYTPLVATIVGISNLVPVFGPIVGAVVCAIIIMISDPTMALVFLVTDIVLQQIDANVLYPRILGETMGMEGVWILFAVIVFGGLFGFMGILLGIPFVAVALAVWEMFIQEKIKQKETTARGTVNTD